MKTINELLPTKPNQNGPTDSPGSTSQTQTQFNHDKEVFVGIWRALQAARHITKDEAVGGTEYTYWRVSLAELTNEDLKRGLDEIKSFTDYMTLGAFRDLCQPEEYAPCHKEFVPLPAPPVDLERRKALAAKLRKDTGFEGKAPSLQKH